MTNYFGKNLKYLREKRNIEQLELATLLNRKSASSISEWEKGTYTPKSGVLSDIARIFNVSLQDLMEKDLTTPSNLLPVLPQTVQIPLLGKIACGDPITAIQNIGGYIYKSPEGLPSGELRAVEAAGDSMEPTIPNKAIVLIRIQPDVENGEIAAILVNGNEEVTLKRVKKIGETIILMPDNPKHEPQVVSKDNPITIIGKAISFESRL